MFRLDFESYTKQYICGEAVSNFSWPVHVEKDSPQDGPTRGEVLLQLGILYWRRGDFDRSERLLDKACEVSEEEKNIRFLAQCFIGLALVKTSLEKPADAISAYEHATALMTEETGLVFPWLRLAGLYVREHQYTKAIETYKQALSFDSKNMDAWNGLGDLHIKTGSFQEAIHAFSRVLALNPQDEQAFENMKTAIRAEREEHTEKAFKPPAARPKTSIPDETNWFYCKYNPWSAYLLDKRPKRITTEGQSHPQKGERVMPSILPLPSILDSDDTPAPHTDEESDPRTWNEKGNLHFDNHDYEDAAHAYNRAIELDPEFGQPYNNLALIFYLQGKYTASILHYQKSIELLTNDHEKSIAWNGLGNAYRSVKDYGNASIAYQNASQLDKTNGGFYDNNSPFAVNMRQKTPDFWNALGKLFFKAGAYDKAISAFQEAIQLEPSSGRSYGNLARTFAAQGQYQEAVSLYHKSIDLTPGKTEKAIAWNRLGDVHRKLKDYDAARKAYQTATALSGDKSSLLNRTRFSLLSNCGVK